MKMNIAMKQVSRNKHRRWQVTALSFLLCHLSFAPVAAQSFTDRVQRQSAAGRVTIHQDGAITDLVNGKTQEAAAPTQRRTTRPGEGHRTTTTPAEHHSDAATATTTTTTATTTTTTTPSTDSLATARQHQRMRKVAGFRIQVFTGGGRGADKRKAYQVKEQMGRLFPEHKCYVKFYSPNWTCRMGNFRTMGEAREVIQQLSRMGYDTAFPLRGMIEVPY